MYLQLIVLLVAVLRSVNCQDVTITANSTGGYVVLGSLVIFNCTSPFQVGNAVLVGGSTNLINASFSIWENDTIVTSSAVYASGYSSRLTAKLQNNVKTVLFSLSSVVVGDARAYYCVAYSSVDGGGSTPSANTVQLLVTALPQSPQVSIYSPWLNQAIAVANYSLQITCIANVGFPYTTVVSPGLAVTIGSLPVVATDVFPPVLNTDTTYTLRSYFLVPYTTMTSVLNGASLQCSATNDYLVRNNLPVVSAQQPLTVQYPVNQIWLLYNSHQAMTDTQVILTVAVLGNDVVQCQANGQPEPTYTWTLVSGSTSFLSGSHNGEMIVPDGLQTSITYTCMATNTVIGSSTSLYFTVTFSITPSASWLAEQSNVPVKTYNAAASLTPAHFVCLLTLLFAILLLRL